MSNYPNMSYCQCENTLSAMRQVLNNMEQGGAEFIIGMSRQERRAFQELFNACEAFLELSEQIQAELDSAEAERVYPDEDA